MIPTAVDLTRFAPGPRPAALARRLGVADGDLVVAHASNLKPLKRPLDVVESARRALRRDPRLLYVIVGDGPGRRAMEDACDVAGLRARFRFVGWQEPDTVADYLRLADIVVLPSESEGLARVGVETQASGRVLIASDISATRELVEDGETGLVFPMGDVGAFADRTLLVAGSGALRVRIGRQARKHAGAHGLDGAVGAYEGTLGALVERHRRRAHR